MLLLTYWSLAGRHCNAKNHFVHSNVGWPADGTSAFRPQPFERKSWLGSDPIALGARVVSVVAAFNAARPADARFGVDTFSAIQPATMSRTREGVYTRLIHGDRMAGHSDKHEISVRCVIPRAASCGTAVIRCFVTRICPGARRFVLHDMVVTRAKRPQMTAQSAYRDPHERPPSAARPLEIRNGTCPAAVSALPTAGVAA